MDMCGLLECKLAPWRLVREKRTKEFLLVVVHRRETSMECVAEVSLRIGAAMQSRKVRLALAGGKKNAKLSLLGSEMAPLGAHNLLMH
eukprot:m.308521 g.308521  ORF g.308521 m.308521 type:complete len:88 (-) comp23027_c6_seq11:929-1192(-)